MCKIVQVSA